MQDHSLLGNDFIEVIICIFVSCFDGSKLNALLFCRCGVGCLPFLILYFVEAPYMSMFFELFAHFLAELINIESMFCSIEILDLNGII